MTDNQLLQLILIFVVTGFVAVLYNLISAVGSIERSLREIQTRLERPPDQ